MENKVRTQSKETSLKNATRIFCTAFAGIAIITIVILLALFFKDLAVYNEKLSSPAAMGMDAAIGLGQRFSISDLQSLAKAEAIATYGEATVNERPSLIENVKAIILSKYTLQGDTYVYNMLPIFMGWPYLYCVIGLLVFAMAQTYVLFRVKKASLTELYCMIALMFMTLNVPSGIFLICSSRQIE